MSADSTTVEDGVEWAAAAIPRQYASGHEIASVLASLGKANAAKYLLGKVPTGIRARSGELGEIIGTQYATRELGYRMLARLRWKDSREMPMRGDDLLGVRLEKGGSLAFLKGEAKSRAYLSKTTLNEAETALLREHGRPSAHSLSFMASRLFEMGDTDLSNRIKAAMLQNRIAQKQVTHLLFTFTGNNPRKILREHTESYTGRVRRLVVGLQVHEHQEFISNVFKRVVRSARTR
ncbi:Hachiman antiphage defense system protein HamA [Cryobacterium breve]|nr:Hachiman antiphage defense system protein HamA [Cryobacterium breve]